MTVFFFPDVLVWDTVTTDLRSEKDIRSYEDRRSLIRTKKTAVVVDFKVYGTPHVDAVFEVTDGPLSSALVPVYKALHRYCPPVLESVRTLRDNAARSSHRMVNGVFFFSYMGLFDHGECGMRQNGVALVDGQRPTQYLRPPLTVSVRNH